jgi:hypothetical protein
MQLILEDIATDTTVVKIPVNEHDEGYWFVDFNSPIYQNFSFQIDCALYGLNEGQVDHDTIEDDDGKEYIRWFILNDLVEVEDDEETTGFIAKFYDKLYTEDEYITYDAYYPTRAQMESALVDYIKNDLFLQQNYVLN